MDKLQNNDLTLPLGFEDFKDALISIGTISSLLQGAIVCMYDEPCCDEILECVEEHVQELAEELMQIRTRVCPLCEGMQTVREDSDDNKFVPCPACKGDGAISLAQFRDVLSDLEEENNES